MSQQNQVHLQLAEMVRELSREHVEDIETLMLEMTRAAVDYVPGADSGGMTMVESSRAVRTIGATDEVARRIDGIQERHGEGPCLSAAWELDTVLVDDFADDHRWPQFRQAALAETPVRSSLSFRMFTHRTSMGALNLYSTTPGAFDHDAVELGSIFATHSAVLWAVSLRDDQFRSALASRDLIGQAKGMLMERFGIDAIRAFDLLTRLSQESNTRVIDVARKVVDTGPTI
ncbi:GAF and ANTAR domain-containing protein [Mycolicibacterium sp. F2034L]|uniref:GAF and ANTAR domain-containing protein n=1 Tax=Mycolicibacterium sp. F2034L TaxID=2926422 RepID=UPI001FF6B46C|nr:GAF and ANTAR domain-containing protein [Mycolicibacterium sp. F2034L]MCK0177260.1 GAF and ANTAR domain-containing protein [Mycolicibacterium sp. F2034L]